MRVKIHYTIPGNEQPLQDVLNWPDVTSIEEVTPHVATYLDNKYGANQYTLVGIEEV